MLVGGADHCSVSAASVVESCGLWGCLLAGMLAARLAQLSIVVITASSNIHSVGMFTTMNWTIISSMYKCLQHY